jgi:ribose transport system substrate-binding protein
MFKTIALVGTAIIALSVPALAKDLSSVGITVGPLTNPFFVQLATAAEAKAKELSGGKAEVTAVSADYDLHKQEMQINNFIDSGADMVVLTAADSEAIAPALQRLQAAGIVSVAMDVAAKGANATVTTDNVQAGREACQFIADKLQGNGHVLILDGPPVSSVIDRIHGCKGVFANFPGINILSDSQNGQALSDRAFDVIVGLLNAHAKIDAVFTINDLEAINTDLAAKQVGRKEFFIASVDGSPAIEAALKQPGSLIAASAAQDPQVMAQTAVAVGYDILQGKPPAQEVILIPSQLVTRDNIDQYKGWMSK